MDRALLFDVDGKFTDGVDGFQLDRWVHVPFAVGAVFEVLPKVVAVPLRRVHGMGRFGDEEPVVRTVKCKAVNDAPRDHDVVPRFEGHLAQHGVEGP